MYFTKISCIKFLLILFYIVEIVESITIKSLNQVNIKSKNSTASESEDNNPPYIAPRITIGDNNPSLDHVIVENHNFYTNKQAKPIPKIYRPEETTYQETENYVVRKIKSIKNLFFKY